MRSPTAQILDTALALQRAPGERFRLHERQLPDGILAALEIASGSPTALRDAAADLGEDEQRILESVRFYLEQVLFATPDADAYRVLGVARDAPLDTIRTHHRWLQRWLHPDRAQAGDASVFATRVNQAWSQLRSPEQRHAYDVSLVEAQLAGATAPLSAAPLHRWQGSDAEVGAPSQGRRSRWLLAAALISCVVLATMILRHQETIAPWEQPEHPDLAQATPAMDDSDVGILAEAFKVATHAGAQLVREVRRDATPALVRRPAAPVIVQSPRAVPPPPIPTAPLATSAPPAPLIPPAPIRVAADPVVAPPTANAVAAPVESPPTPVDDPALLFERLRLAQVRMDELAGYLASRPRSVPMWNDVATQAATERARVQISAGRGARFELINPKWTLAKGSANATVRSDYRCRAASAGQQQGRLNVQLVWREGMWLVRSLELEPSA